MCLQAAEVKDRKIEQLCAQLRKCQEAGLDALEATGLDTTAFEETQATGEHTPQDTMVCAALSKLQIGYLAQKQRGEVLQAGVAVLQKAVSKLLGPGLTGAN